jgi:hypothetical protein
VFHSFASTDLPSFPTIIPKDGKPVWVQRIYTASDLLRNDRALAIGLLAALLSVCAHNLVDDLYVHSLTNLIALLLIVLIRIEGVTTKEVGIGG